MIVLTDLPTEILLIIISHLKVIPTTTKESLRRQNRQAILPLKANKALWKIARPLLYHDIELSFRTTDEKDYHVKLRTSLLYRTLQEEPLLRLHVRTLKVKGFRYNAFGYWRDAIAGDEAAAARHKLSTVHINKSELADLLTSFVNTRVFKVITPNGLHTDIQHHSNQILLSCIKSMLLLHTLELGAGKLPAEANLQYPNPIIHFLNAASNRLQSLTIGPPYGDGPESNEFQEFPDYSHPAPEPRSSITSLAIAGEKVPLAIFYPWISSRLQSLHISEILLLNGQTNQGPRIRSILAPMASTLQELYLHVNFSGDAPLISDLDMTEFPLLESFTYHGPWMIRANDQPFDICQSLFPKSYRFLKLHLAAVARSPEVTLNSVKDLRDAFALAHQQNLSPIKCTLTLVLKGRGRYTYDELFRRIVREEFEGLKREVCHRGVEMDRCLVFPHEEQTTRR
jgi:hypothetical protein